MRERAAEHGRQHEVRMLRNLADPRFGKLRAQGAIPVAPSLRCPRSGSQFRPRLDSVLMLRARRTAAMWYGVSRDEASCHGGAAAETSRIEGIGPFHCKAGLTDLRGVRRCNARELCPNVVNDVEVAVRAVVISQTQIGTDRLRI